MKEECAFQWDEKRTPLHVCIKARGHVTDITDNDHRCCCGANTWSYDDE